MTRIRKAFAAAAIAALIAPAAVVAALSTPAAADEDGKHRHDLDTYKREAWVEVLGTAPANTAHVHLACDANDYALDGMWKLDAHDGNDRSFRAPVSERDLTNYNNWHFEFTNDGPGRAQVKIFVTCLDNRTGERDGHSHLVKQGTRKDSTVTIAPHTNSDVVTATCDADQIPVSPSYQMHPGVDARIFASYPTATGWQWQFRGGANAGGINVSIHCLERLTSSSPGHTHEIDADLKVMSPLASVPVGEQNDYRLAARPHDEGNVGAFSISNPGAVWYLGQDAQGQVRGFRFLNAGPGASNVAMAVWGFDKRTKKNP